MWRFVMATITALSWGCGGRTCPGSGSGTLSTQIIIEGKPDSTVIEADLSADGNPVIGANVVFDDIDLNETVTAERVVNGLYRAAFRDYVQTIKVRIVAGDDELDAQLEGPATHIITRPENDAIVRRGDFDFLLVQWSSDDPAQAAEIALGPERVALDTDDGEGRVPLVDVPDGELTLSVSRETSVILRGGVEGSRMISRYVVDNRITLER